MNNTILTNSLFAYVISVRYHINLQDNNFLFWLCILYLLEEPYGMFFGSINQKTQEDKTTWQDYIQIPVEGLI